MDFQDNSQAVKAQLEKNIAKALTMMGYKWQEIVTMENRYTTKIRAGRWRGNGHSGHRTLDVYLKNVML